MTAVEMEASADTNPWPAGADGDYDFSLGPSACRADSRDRGRERGREKEGEREGQREGHRERGTPHPRGPGLQNSHHTCTHQHTHTHTHTHTNKNRGPVLFRPLRNPQ